MNTTTNKSPLAKQELPICEETMLLDNIPLYYRLKAVGNDRTSHFLISVCNGEECVEVDAGSDLLRALTHFRRIANGRVTPCTLCDVLHDLHYFELF